MGTLRASAEEGITIENSAGNIELSDLSCGFLQCDQDSGNISLDQVNVSGELRLGTDMGNITFGVIFIKKLLIMSAQIHTFICNGRKSFIICAIYVDGHRCIKIKSGPADMSFAG